LAVDLFSLQLLVLIWLKVVSPSIFTSIHRYHCNWKNETQYFQNIDKNIISVKNEP